MDLFQQLTNSYIFLIVIEVILILAGLAIFAFLVSGKLKKWRGSIGSLHSSHSSDQSLKSLRVKVEGTKPETLASIRSVNRTLEKRIDHLESVLTVNKKKDKPSEVQKPSLKAISEQGARALDSLIKQIDELTKRKTEA